MARLRRNVAEVIRVRATRPFPRTEAVRIYRYKAAKGDRAAVRTEGYPALLAALDETLESEVIIHGVTFADAVYLVVTDSARNHCVGVLRKTLLGANRR
jgi:hypothetical protein